MPKFSIGAPVLYGSLKCIIKEYSGFGNFQEYKVEQIDGQTFWTFEHRLKLDYCHFRENLLELLQPKWPSDGYIFCPYVPLYVTSLICK